ncbi:MAG: DUF4394 domain-containing protein [Planctomycetes bacterium]|nr:DUF4394 domain-containing protein [Planctomycetota bacterium]
MSLPIRSSALSLLALSLCAAEAGAQDLYALTASHRLLGIRTQAPGRLATNVAITGLSPGEALVDLDFRPATGELYALGATSRLYRIDVRSGAATPVGAPFATPLVGTQFGMDFNPTVDRIRIVSDADQNLRAHPETGAIAAVDGSLAFLATDRFRALNPNVVACAYTNSVPGATTTRLLGLDSNVDALLLQDPPNAGGLGTIGLLGINTSAIAAFDISGKTGEAWAALTTPGVGISASIFARIDINTGAAQFLATAGIAEPLIGISFVPPGVAPSFGGQELYLATEAGRLLTIDSAAPGLVRSDVAITGLDVGERVLGIDIRPATGELYALGSTSRLYVLDPATAVATAVGSPFATALSGVEFGFDFNPTVDRIRITSDAGQNLRAHPVTGAIAAVDGALSYDASDLAAGQVPEIIGSGYTHSVPMATSTVLYNLDRRRDTLVVQDPPNAGVLNTVGALGFDVAGVGGFDIVGTTGIAYAVLSSAGSTSPGLFAIDLGTGRATFLATLPLQERIAGLSARPVYRTAQYGVASPGCNGASGIGANRSPAVGDALFAIRGSNAPAFAEGRLALGIARSVPPVRLADLAFHVSPFEASTMWAVASSDGLGIANVGVPLPSDPQLQGLAFFAQFFWIDPCGPSGLSASHGLALEIR